MNLSEGSFQVLLPPWLVIPVIWRCPTLGGVVLLAAFPSERIPVAATACLVLFLLALGPAAGLGRLPAWRIMLQSVAPVAAFLPSVSSAVCARPLSASALASLSLPAHAW